MISCVQHLLAMILVGRPENLNLIEKDAALVRL